MIETTELSEFDLQVAEIVNQMTGNGSAEDWLMDTLGANRSASGVRVNVNLALSLPAVWHSVSVLTSHLASLPIEVHKRQREGGSTADINDPMARLLNQMPNGSTLRSVDYQNAFIFKQTLLLHAILQGNGRAWIERNPLSGVPQNLYLIHPNNTWTLQLGGKKYHFVYFHKYESQTVGQDTTPIPEDAGRQFWNEHGAMYQIPDRDVLHIHSLSNNGLWGYSLVELMRETFGLDAAGRNATSFSFQNNGRPGMTITAPKGLLRTEREAEEFMANVDKAHKGIDKAGRTMLLREGMTAQTIPMSSADAQFLESRTFSRDDISLIFGTEYIMGETSGQYKDLPSRMSAYVTNTLNAWMEQIEQECWRKLLDVNQQKRNRIFFQMNPKRLLRGSPNDLADYTGKLRQQRLINGDEAREMHGLNPTGEESMQLYDNPNTSTPGDAELVETDDGGTDGGEDEAAARMSTIVDKPDEAVRMHFENLIQSEIELVCKKSAKEKGFLNRIDAFYRDFEDKLCGICDRLELPRGPAQRYCRKSYEQILDLSGVTQPENLETEMKRLTATWPDRIEELING